LVDPVQSDISEHLEVRPDRANNRSEKDAVGHPQWMVGDDYQRTGAWNLNQVPIPDFILEIQFGKNLLNKGNVGICSRDTSIKIVKLSQMKESFKRAAKQTGEYIVRCFFPCDVQIKESPVRLNILHVDP